jgi:hypothetical protein
MAGTTSHYFTATGPGVNGYYTQAARLNYGVNVQGTEVGVYGEALQNSPLNRAAPNGTGVCGLGDNAGVIGQSLPVMGVDANGLVIVPGATSPPPPTSYVPAPPDSPPDVLEPIPALPLQYSGVGVSGFGTLVGALGQGFLFGVQGICQTSSYQQGGSVGTGVQGLSDRGVGVSGVSTGVVDPFNGQVVVPAYIGVFGSAQSTDQPNSPYPIAGGAFDHLLATGVVGVGGNYGGAFQPNPELDPSMGVSLTFANVQLTPIGVPDAPGGAVVTPYTSKAPATPLPWLPIVGQPGDIVTVFRNGETQVWVCLKPQPPSQVTGATWGRVNFDYVCVMPPGP